MRQRRSRLLGGPDLALALQSPKLEMGIGSATTPRPYSNSAYSPPQRVAYGGDGSDRPRSATATPVDTTRQAAANVRYGGDGSDMPKPLSLTNKNLEWKSVQPIAPWT